MPPLRKNPVKNTIKSKSEPDVAFTLSIKNGNLSIDADWPDGNLNVKSLGALLGVIATGEIFASLLETTVDALYKKGEPEEILQELHAVIETRLIQHQEKVHQETKMKRPCVEPIRGIQHLMTMYHQPTPD